MFAKKLLRTIYFNFFSLKVKKNYFICKNISETKFNYCVPILLKNFKFYDESNLELQKMFSLNPQIITDKYSINQNQININTQKTDGENWVIFQTRIPYKNYKLTFDYFPSNNIHEFQIAFNLQDLKNRNRFIIMEGRQVLFDYIRHGIFFKPIECASFDVFMMNKKNTVEVEVLGSQYRLKINGNTIVISEKKRLFSSDNFAIILWENFMNRPINCKICNINLFYN